MNPRSASRLRAGRSSTPASRRVCPPFQFGLEPLETREVFSAPVVTTFAATASILAPGESVTLRGTATDDFGIRAVTFFVDRNANGRFDAGADESLGDVFTADPGNPGRYSLTITANTSWGNTPQFCCDAVDTTGVWSGAPRATSVTVAPLWEVSQLFIRPVGAAAFIIEAMVHRPQVTGALETNPVGVTFFADRNANGRWDGSTIDTDLGFVTNPDSEDRYIAVVTIQNWVNPKRITAAVMDDRAAGNPWGPTRMAAPRDGAGGLPLITDVRIESFDPPQIPGAVVNGEWFKITADATASAGIVAVTFYYDKNNNGLWDAGIDTDLGAQFVGNGQTQGTFERLVQARDELFTAGGFQHIGVAVKDASGRPNDAWSPSHSGILRVITPPRINTPTTAASVARGQTITLEFNAPDDFATRTVSAFLDKNGNGLFDAGTDIVGTNPIRFLGKAANGRWRITISTSGITSAGTFTLYMAGVDFEGGWGRRGSTTIQIT